jgi:hypothetical protein
MPYLDESKIALPKDESDYNVWADHIELLAMLHPDRKLTVEAIKDRLIDENDGDPKKALKQINKTARKTTTPAIDKIAEDQFENDTDPEDEQRIKTALLGVLDYMKCRKAIVNDYYPFDIDDAYSVTLIDALTNKNRIYIILLLSSLVKVINVKGGFSYTITHRFEKLCEKPFELLTPAIATKEFFGAGGPDNENPNPGGKTFFEKVSNLASKLCLPLHPNFTKDAAGVHNVGDGGLDWAAYMPFADNLHTVPTFFAQCACGNDWEDKLFDVNKGKWNQYILFSYDYKSYHFIPKSFRDLDNKWLNNISIHSVILIDRFRLIELLEKAGGEDEVVAEYVDLLQELEEAAIDSN